MRKIIFIGQSGGEAFKTLSEAEIDWYLSTGEWQGAAGGYRIQGTAACFITKIEGSYSGIVLYICVTF